METASLETLDFYASARILFNQKHDLFHDLGLKLSLPTWGPSLILTRQTLYIDGIIILVLLTFGNKYQGVDLLQTVMFFQF